MKREIVKTADGSSSIYLTEMDEHYHSKHGAIAESKHIFVEKGLLAKKNLSHIHVFEVGMGTGLNVMTTMQAVDHYKLSVDYHTVEAFPVLKDELISLNFANELQFDDALFLEIHQCSWGEEHQLKDNFQLLKWPSKLEVLPLSSNYYDIIYFDAFAPDKQQELWTDEIFEKLFDALKLEGILVTYCVKGEIRRRLQKVGFVVEKLPGPIGGKREMCRAHKIGVSS